MDPLSDVLSLLTPKNYVTGAFSVAGEISIRMPKHEGIKCYAMLGGQCWLKVDGVPEAILLTAGDCFLLPRGLPFCLTTDLALEPEDFLTVRERLGHTTALDTPDGLFVVAGHFLLTGMHADTLLQSLPPIVHLRTEADKAAMRWSLDRIRQEMQDPQPGGSLITQQLAYMVLVQALRLHLAESAATGVGWMFALADKQMCAAVTGMHDDPGHDWTLQTLAERVGMSRSVFAQRFRQKVGTTPMEYLTRWRMMLAGRRLKEADEPVSAIAVSLGYESESAFSKAFRRVMLCSPRQYRRNLHVAGGVASAAGMGPA